MQAEVAYNWDDIDVGRFDLNHSENFFTQKHLKHEKLSEEFSLIRPIAKMNINEPCSNGVAIESNENKENNKLAKNQHKTQTIDPSLLPIDRIKLENKDNQVEVVKSPTPLLLAKDRVRIENADNHVGEIKSPTSPFLLTNDRLKPENQDNQVAVVTSPTSLITTNSNRRPANLLTRPKTPQPQEEASSGVPSVTSKIGKTQSKFEIPHVYGFKDIYQKKREENMKKLLEEEKKNRIFHSRPVPKSMAMPRELLPRKGQVDYKLTAARTPLVLKNSRVADEKRKQRLEEWKKRNPPVKFTSREALVLQEEPFKPKKTGHTVQIQPFNLHMERRIEGRKQFDEKNRRIAEDKKKQEEEERKKREEELVKELRKLASFKARPNPFK